MTIAPVRAAPVGSRWPRPAHLEPAIARVSRRERAVVALTAVASAAGAVATHPSPTATAVSDVTMAAGLGALVVLASSRAGPRAWLAASLLVATAASGAWMIAPAAVAALSLVVCVLVRSARVPQGRVLGGLAGAAVVQTALRLPDGRFGLNLLASAAAIGCLVIAGRGLWAEPRARRAAVVVGALVALTIGGLATAVLLARGELEQGLSRTETALDAARQGDSDGAARRLEAASRDFRSAHAALDAWWARPALLLPVAGQHERSLATMSDAAADLADAAATSARAASVDDLRVIDGRLDLERVSAITSPLADVGRALDRASEAVAGAGSPWLIPPVADRLGKLERSIDAATADLATASDAIAVLPDLLGADGVRRYFVAFGTPAETRDLGGFMGAYAVVVADEGELRLVRTGRVRDLNRAFNERRALTDLSDLPGSYLAMQPQRFWQNVTGTADLPTMADAVRRLWPDGAYGHLDGVLYMDPEALAALLELTGPIRVPGYDEALTDRTAGPFLLRDQYLEFPDDDRHDFLVDAAETVFDELTTGELPVPSELADVLAPAVHERRLLLHSFHPEEQALFEHLQLDGALPPVRGDFLSVRSSNRGLNKLDVLMQRTVAYDVTVDPARGRVRATLTVTVENHATATGLPVEVSRNRLGLPTGTNSTTVAVYTPLDLVDVTVDGRPIGRGSGREHGRARYTALLDVPPEGEVTVSFELEGSLDLDGGYHLDVVPQPLVNPDALEVAVHAVTGWTPRGEAEVSTRLREREQVDVRFEPSR